MTPELKVLTYFVQENEIIPDNLVLNLQKCLNNKVKLKFYNDLKLILKN